MPWSQPKAVPVRPNNFDKTLKPVNYVNVGFLRKVGHMCD